MDNYGYQPDDNNTKPFTITRYPVENNRSLHNSSFVEVNSRSKLFRNPKFYKRLSMLFIVIAIILLILIIVIVSFYLREKNKRLICLSDECIRSAANLKYSLDLTVNPCDDFYKFTCGRWSDEHPNHGWYPTFSSFATINERVEIAALKFLTSEKNDKEPEPVRQSRDFYTSCTDVDAINKLGLTVVYKYLAEVGLPLVPSLFTKNKDEIDNFKFNWLKTEALIKKTFAFDVLFGFAVDANPFNRSENVMYFGTPDMISPLPSPLRNKNKKLLSRKRNKSDSEEEVDYEELKREVNAKIMKFVLQTVIKNVTSAEPKLETLQEGTSALVNITFYMDELVENYTDYDSYNEIEKPHYIESYQREINEILINNANKNYPLIWEQYLKYLYNGTNVTINTANDLFFIGDQELDYIPRVLSFVMSTPDIYLELYMWWVTVLAMIINTTSEISEYIYIQTAPFYSSIITRSRSLDCSSLVTDFMGMAVSYGIADKTFTDRTKPKVEEMLYNIKTAFVQRVNSIKWMDKPTKNATLEKSKEMLSFIGYPEWLFENGALEAYYDGIEISSNTYLENMMSVIKNYLPSKLAQLRDINERTWRTDPVVVNAFNSFLDNAINIPMAILSFPVYNLGLEVLNYGAIGSILGHELTHGFDNTGRKHDKFGNYKQWWTNQTIETFEEKIKCLIQQYGNFTIDGIEGNIRGERTLGENIADNGGLAHAYHAYQNYRKKFGKEPKLPGFENYSDDQLFFIAFGSIWCETISSDELKNQIMYDEHCPNSIRVKGTLQNSPEFAKAFKCPLNSTMNPNKRKCRVW